MITEVTDTIRAFLDQDEDLGLVFSGDWGTGKTHHALNTIKEWHHEDPKTNKYIYVSLYGKETRTEIDLAIAAALGAAKVNHNFLARLLKRSDFLLSTLKSDRLIGHIAKELARGHVTILDDLERVSENLSMQQVMSYADLLMHTYSIKVILILNRDKLPPGTNQDFIEGCEKSFPRRLRVDPTSDYILETLEADEERDSASSQFIRDLGVTNFRIARRIVTNCRALLDCVNPRLNLDSESMDEMLISACVGTASMQGLRDFPPLEFLNRGIAGYMSDENAPPEHTGWKERLSMAKFAYANELDLEIFRQIDRGYFDADLLASKMTQESEPASAGSGDQLSKVWREFHDSLDGDTAAFGRKLIDAANQSIMQTSIANMNSTILLLRELGYGEDANKLAERYASERAKRSIDLVDFVNDPFANEAELDAVFRAALVQHRETQIVSVTIPELLVDLQERSLTDDDIFRFSLALADDIAAAFRGTNARSIQRTVRDLLALRERPKSSIDREVGLKIERVLRDLAEGSDLNKVRVQKKYGIEIREGGTIE